MDLARRRLHAFAVFLAACTLFLVVAGASVTSKEAGLSVPDWPLSYGQVMPEMKGGIFYEHGHRMVATTVGLLTILLAISIWRVDGRTWMKRLGLAAVGAVIAQGVLGGMTVLFLLPKAVSISHACLAELFFSTTCAIAQFTSGAWRRGANPVESTSFITRRPMVLPVVVLAQVALGAAYRHKALDLVWHAAGAAVATGVVLYAVVSILLHYAGHVALQGTALVLLAITFAQVFLGVGAYMSRVATVDAPQPMPVMVLFTVAHVAVGALTMAFSVLMTIQIKRHVQVAETPLAEVSFAR